MLRQRIGLGAQLAHHALDVAKCSFPARWTPPLRSEARWSRERAQAWRGPEDHEDLDADWEDHDPAIAQILSDYSDDEDGWGDYFD